MQQIIRNVVHFNEFISAVALTGFLEHQNDCVMRADDARASVLPSRRVNVDSGRGMRAGNRYNMSQKHEDHRNEL